MNMTGCKIIQLPSAIDYVEEQRIHQLLLEMDVDQLYHHLKNNDLMNKFVQAKRMVNIDYYSGDNLGCIYDNE